MNDTSQDVTRQTDIPDNQDPLETQFSSSTIIAGKKSKKNILDYYRSYTYNFTLSGVNYLDVNDPDKVVQASEKFVILKSGGKGTEGIGVPAGPTSTDDPNDDVRDKRLKQAANTKKQQSVDFVSGFNKNSPGRFDFFIDSVEIKTLMTPSGATAMSLATNIKFDVVEPYSINGFLEALQAAALATGYDSYQNAVFLFKIEFFGYPDEYVSGDQIDNDNNPDEPQAIVPNKTTRYFIMNFTSISVDTSEKGTKYRCSAIFWNDKAYGLVNRLKQPISISGTTVGEILTDLADKLTKREQQNNQKNDPSAGFDEYKILFQASMNTDPSTDTEIYKSKVSDLYRDAVNYKFADPEDPATPANATQSAGKAQPTPEEMRKQPERIKLTPGAGKNGPQVQFAENANVSEIIMAIIRDSDYGKDILKNIDKKIDSNGLVDYFMVRTTVKHKAEFDKTSRQHYKIYTYIINPYKVPYTMIPNLMTAEISQGKLSRLAKRVYDYIYTGKNNHILNFSLKFNHLFIEAVPPASSLIESMKVAEALSKGNGTQQTQKGNEQSTLSTQAVDNLRRVAIPMPIQADGGNANAPQQDQYYILARHMHEAIVNSNGSMITGELEIIGDPFYITGNSALGKEKVLTENDDNYETDNGEANPFYSFVFIVINFRNPVDIRPLEEGGTYFFDTKKVPFSGVYFVTEVMNIFSDGIFKQRLTVNRVLGQTGEEETIDYKKEIAASQETKSNPLDAVVQDTTVASSQVAGGGLRPDSVNILTQQKRALPSQGIPGLVSNFAAIAGVGLTVGSLLNSVSGGTSNGIGRGRSESNVFGGAIPGGPTQSASGIRVDSSVLGRKGLLEAAAVNAAGKGTPIPNSDLALASEIKNLKTAASKLPPVAGSGIGVNASISIPNTAIPQSALTQTSDGLSVGKLAAVAGTALGAATLMNNASDKISSILGGTSLDPAGLAKKFGINTSQLSGLSDNLKSKAVDQLGAMGLKVPKNFDISASTANLDNLTPDQLSKLPPTAPMVAAPPPRVDTEYLKDLVARKGEKGLANAYGVNDISKIPSTLLPEDIKKEVMKSIPSGIKNPFSSLSQLAGVAMGAMALGNQLLTKTGQVNTLIGQAGSRESTLASVQQVAGQSVVTGQLSADASSIKFGSKTPVSPLIKLVG